jgi:hypothetical protein
MTKVRLIKGRWGNAVAAIARDKGELRAKVVQLKQTNSG